LGLSLYLGLCVVFHKLSHSSGNIVFDEIEIYANAYCK
jgi:hypothetical protein